jgi:cation:H+ antiporter
MLLALSIIGGLVCLVIGADALVRGASRLAFAIGIPPLIVGLTVVAFGTSAPELAVSVRAAFAGEAGVGLGNVFGSNIVNVLLILGISSMITPLVVSRQLIRWDVPIMIVVSAAAMAMAWDLRYTRGDGLILVSGLMAYLLLQWYLVKAGGKSLSDLTDDLVPEDEVETEKSSMAKPILVALVQCGLGFGGLVVGSYFLVEGAVELAMGLGVSEEIIGLTIVAIGTSLPEIVTSIVAAARGQRDLAVGNVVGSNLFNLMVVLGVASIVSPAPIQVAPSLLEFDIPVMLATAVLCFPIFLTGKIISRKEGVFMVICYLAYNVYQIFSLTPMVKD